MDTVELTHGSSLLTSGLSHYNRWMALQLNRLGPLQGTVLEFGCGSGGLTRALAQLPGVDRVIANDVSPHVKDYFRSQFAADARVEFVGADILSAPREFDRIRYDWAVSSNTLEHVERDGEALRRIAERARTRQALILVPAFNCLYGTCDRDGGHLRRYTKRTFTRMAEAGGLQVERVFYFNMVGAFAWWAQYVLLKRDDYTAESHAQTYSTFNRFVVPLYSRIERFLPCASWRGRTLCQHNQLTVRLCCTVPLSFLCGISRNGSS
jgi:SAM-dependent methyltransferase